MPPLNDDDILFMAENVSKRFGQTIALDKVDFELRRGEVHGLLGENGAGKTTLCNIIYGMIKPDGGQLYLEGRRVRFSSPREAMAAGIGMVHQEFTLIPNLTVVDNVILFTGGDGIVVRRSKAAERLERYASEYGLSISPYAKVSELSAGEKQRLEILKALMHGVRILILDEPTSVLTRIEAAELFRAIRKMADEGRSVILVTHKMDDVISAADRITVLRQGRRVATIEGGRVDRTTLARLIVNRDVVFNLEKEAYTPGEPIIQISDITCVDQAGVRILKGASLQVRRGEILGVCGVAGNGQKELVEAIMGLRQVSSGTIRFMGRDITSLPPHMRRWLGIGYIPEEFSIGLVPEFRLYENFVLPPTVASRFTRKGLLVFDRLRDEAADLMNKYQIRASSPNSFTWSLSGGNKQKLLLAREFYQQPILILAHNPTKGLDVAATEYVRKFLLDVRSQGRAVLLVSNDLDEVLEMSDRILVMYGGRIVGEFNQSTVDLDRVAKLMLGSS